MVSIAYDKTTENLLITIGGDNFRDLVDFLKENYCRWNPDMKAWTLHVTRYNDFLAELQTMGEVADIDMLSQSQIEDYFKSLKELRFSGQRHSFHQELMNYPPLTGKHPYENFQLQDILRGINQNRFLYHHDMGLGKSYILTALIEHLRYYGDIDKALIFSSSIGVLNLKDELCKLGHDMNPDDIIAFTSASNLPFDDRDIFNTDKYPQKTIILTYDVLKSISNYYYDKANGTKKKPHPSAGVDYRKNFLPIADWLNGKNAGLFLDENHGLSNPKSRRTEIMNFIISQFEFRYEFTGTLADKYEKLYEPCKILDKDLVDGKDYTSWLLSYNDVGNRFSKYAVNPTGWDLDALKVLNEKMLKSYCSKRKLSECLDLPLNIEVPTIYIDMSPLQRKIYEKFSNFSANEIASMAAEQGKSFSDKMQNMFAYFQQAVDNPSCIKKSAKFASFPKELQDDILKYDYNKDSTKIEMVDEIIKDRTDDCDEKGIIWYFHPETMEALKERYKSYKPVIISADVPMEERVPMVKKFLANDKQKLIIASINVMNTSMTLIECKYEVYVEKTYNYTTYVQSRGRIFRPGQKDITRTYTLRYNNSLDNLQELNLQTKGETLNSLFNRQYIEQDMWHKLFNMQRGDKVC